MDSETTGRTLITGASAGIGRALAVEFAGHGHDLTLVARREDRLRDLAATLADRNGVSIDAIPMDLAADGAASDLYATVRERSLHVETLVNNVGIGTYGRFHESSLPDERRQVRLNVALPVELTRRFLPAMVERGEGGVLNLGSMAGFQPGPYMAGYYASKAYVNSFSEGLAEELRGTGVTVTVLCPGPVDTEFQDRADMGDSTVGSTVTHSAEEVARAGYEGLMAGETVVVPGLPMKALYLLSRVAPRAVTRRVARYVNADR